jgi:hypothetical protein
MPGMWKNSSASSQVWVLQLLCNKERTGVGCMSRWTPEQHKRIDEIQTKIARLAQEFREIVKPSDEEIKNLLEDLEMNPHIYVSNLEDDDLFIAENVYQEIVAREEN